MLPQLPREGFIERSEYRGPDPIERRTLVLHADVRITEINDCVMQLFDFLPPSRSPLPVSDILKKIRDYIRKIVLNGCDISLMFLLFRVQVKVTPGHGIEIYIKRLILNNGTPTMESSQNTADYELIYTGEWR